MNARAALVSSRPGAALCARTRGSPPSVVGLEARLLELAIFPVKAGCGAALARPRRAPAASSIHPGLADRGVMLAVRQPGETPDGEGMTLGLANRNEATLALARAFLEDGALVYARGLAAVSRASLPRAGDEASRIRVKLPYAGGPVIEGIVDDGPLATWVRDLLRAHPARRYDVRDVVAVRAGVDHRRSVAERMAQARTRERSSATAHALVASASTLAWMNDVLMAEGHRAIPMEHSGPTSFSRAFRRMPRM